jgi:mono/diheme cytochrome c family protein
MPQIRHGLLALLGLGLLIQLVPYGRDHENPPLVQEPSWDRPRTRELFFRACKDCHSNQTEWPWYSFVSPASWLVQRDVEEGRSHFNVSEWGRAENHGDEAAKLVRGGEMPPWFYLPAHPEARLSDREREELVAGLVATFGEEVADHSDDHDHDH